jgi:hypothetical protein
MWGCTGQGVCLLSGYAALFRAGINAATTKRIALMAVAAGFVPVQAPHRAPVGNSQTGSNSKTRKPSWQRRLPRRRLWSHHKGEPSPFAALIIILATSRLGRAQRNPTISEVLLGFAMLSPTYMDSAGRNDDHCPFRRRGRRRYRFRDVALESLVVGLRGRLKIAAARPSVPQGERYCVPRNSLD